MSQKEDDEEIDTEIEEEKNIEEDEYIFSFVPNIYLREIKGFKTKANYRTLFYTLPEDVRDDLKNQTEYLYKMFSTSNIESSYHPEFVRDMCDIPIIIEIFKKVHFNKLLFNVGFIISQNKANARPIQAIQYSFITFSHLKNAIFNTLFHLYICMNYFEYSKLFDYFYFKDDLLELNEIRLRELRLFASIKDMDCCVCLEKTITKTSCNHNLCDACFFKLKNKLCPLCRRQIDVDEIDDIDIVIQTNI